MTTNKIQVKIEDKAKFDFVEATKRYEFWITNYVKETGSNNVGLFIDANNEKEALKYFKALIKIIREKGVEINDE